MRLFFGNVVYLLFFAGLGLLPQSVLAAGPKGDARLVRAVGNAKFVGQKDLGVSIIDFPSGPVDATDPLGATRIETIEGVHTIVTYDTTEVEQYKLQMANQYESLLTEAGFEILFHCVQPDGSCGKLQLFSQGEIDRFPDVYERYLLARGFVDDQQVVVAIRLMTNDTTRIHIVRETAPVEVPQEVTENSAESKYVVNAPEQ